MEPVQSIPREPIRNVDKAWLDMDTPTNLMVINGVMLFDAPIRQERFMALLEERLVGRYRRFCQRAVDRPGPGGLAWEADPHFDLRSHLRHIALPEPGDEATLQALIGDLISEPLDRQKPLWRFYLIDNVNGGCAVFARLHHCIADGIALVQVLLSLTDEHPDADDEGNASFGAEAQAEAVVYDSLTDAMQVARPPDPTPAPATAARARRRRSGLAAVRGMVAGAALGAGRLARSAAAFSLHQGYQSLSNPHTLLEKAYTGGLISLTGAAILAKLMVLPPDNDSVFKGDLGVHKRVIWSQPLALERVKAIGRSTGSTVNDVLVTAVAGALRRYMEDRGGAVDIRTMVPVNLRDPNKPLKNLGNEFALVYLNLPLQEPQPTVRLREIKRQMDMLKQSPEPLLIYEILNVIGMVPGELADWATNWFSTKASAVMTNVPGPRQRLYFCGRPLQRIMFWVPQSGRIGLGISIISYCGEVLLGVMVDERLVAEPEAILAGFEEELAALQRAPQGKAQSLAEAPPAVANGRPT